MGYLIDPFCTMYRTRYVAYNEAEHMQIYSSICLYVVCCIYFAFDIMCVLWTLIWLSGECILVNESWWFNFWFKHTLNMHVRMNFNFENVG